MTFTSLESSVKVSGQSTSGGTVKASFQFRTHDEDGLMLYHKLDKNGEVSVSRILDSWTICDLIPGQFDLILGKGLIS